MEKKTDANLRAAFSGESQAHMKYRIFAEKAEKENLPNIARLFKAVSFAEKAHASNHYRIMGKIGKTSENLENAILGENYEIEEMYPKFKEVAVSEGDKQAAQAMSWALEVEKIHRDMYSVAKKAADEGHDIKVGSIVVCDVCGYTKEGNALDKCPICGAKKERFQKF